MKVQNQEFRDNEFPAFPVVFQHRNADQNPQADFQRHSAVQQRDVFSSFPVETISKLKQKIGDPLCNRRYLQLFKEKIENLAVEKFIEQYEPLNRQFFNMLTQDTVNLKLCRVGAHKVYFGEVDGDGHCNGMGVLLFKSGHIYEGQFSRNRRCGSGIYLEYGTGWYQGFFENDVKEGEGIEVLLDKTAYLGQFHNGLKHGKGHYVDTNNNSYYGDWKLGIMHGSGYLQNQSSIYWGEVANWLKHGKGELKFENGDHYKGDFQNNKFDGFGNYEWRQGELVSTYEGNFKNGLRHGKGKWQSQGNQETKYIGSYSEGLKEGYGELYFPSGNFYKGNFVLDKRQGYGEMFWTDGSFYKGQWKEGIQQGKGQIYLSGSEVLSGIFQNSMLVQIIPTFYEKQVNQMSTSAGTRIDAYQSREPTGIQHTSERALSENRKLHYRRRNLARIQESSVPKPHQDSISKNKMYFRSPEKSDHSKGKLNKRGFEDLSHAHGHGTGHRECKCMRRLQNFQQKQKRQAKLNKSLGNAPHH